MDDVTRMFFRSLKINPELTLISLAESADPTGQYRSFIETMN